MQNPPPPPPGSEPPAPMPPPGGGYAPPPASYAPPPPPAAYPAQQGYAAQTSYGGFWIRVVARIVDGIILGIPIGIIFVIFASIFGGIVSSTSNQNTQQTAGLAAGGVFILLYLLALVVVIGYQIYFWGTSGSTLGMRLFRLRVVDANTGATIGMGRATLRWLMTIVNSIACYIGWIWVAFDARKQGWHDKVANTVVIHT